ncbi:TIR domain-containing protein [Oleiharenicola lentus]|uniref:TIR domain-containing protein n=1 Tax=Oleiharenicola lentus TaxID=2508720 RepID=UPI003F677588
MAKKVFFSFHYQDVIDFRANVVRNHWLTKPDREEAGYFDESLWEATKKTGVEQLKELINSGLDGTSVTVVLIGSDTYARRWVKYEIMRSMFRGNRLIGVHINAIAGKDRQTKAAGANPFSHLGYTYSVDGWDLSLWELVNGTWVAYPDHSGYRLKTQAPLEKRGKGYALTDSATSYDWVANKGYENFSDWVS